MARSMIGIVSSDKADKTIVVTVQTSKTHPLYHKQYTVSTKFMAHDEKNEAQTGDKVQITETKPLSARKRFVLAKIIEKPAIREEQKVGVIKDEEKPVESKKSDDDKETKPAKVEKEAKEK